MKSYRLDANNYLIFYCIGKNKTYRESGPYSSTGSSYIEAASNLSKHLNKINKWIYGNIDSNWISIGQKEGYPKEHMFVSNNNGNKWLIIKTAT